MNPYLAKLRGLTRENHHLSKPSKPSKPSFEGFEGRPLSQFPGIGRTERVPYANLLAALQSQRPELIEPGSWEQAVRDTESFLATWGDQAEALGWTARDLFGLHPVPERPAASYRRLARYDETGLIWLLHGRPVVALTETTAAIQGAAAVLTYRKLNKPALTHRRATVCSAPSRTLASTAWVPLRKRTCGR
jgi:hypothetical protein